MTSVSDFIVCYIVRNSSESDPHSYEGTKKVQRRYKEGTKKVQSFNGISEFFLGFLCNCFNSLSAVHIHVYMIYNIYISLPEMQQVL